MRNKLILNTIESNGKVNEKIADIEAEEEQSFDNRLFHTLHTKSNVNNKQPHGYLIGTYNNGWRVRDHRTGIVEETGSIWYLKDHCRVGIGGGMVPRNFNPSMHPVGNEPTPRLKRFDKHRLDWEKVPWTHPENEDEAGHGNMSQ
jgi:hypothetical protein